MPKMTFIISIVLAVSILCARVGDVHAQAVLQAGPPVQGTIQRITLDNDASTGITTVIVDLRQGQDTQIVRLSQEAAIRLGLVTVDGDGKLRINNPMLGKHTTIESPDVLPVRDEKHHPVGDALATFFSEIEGLNYDAIMDAHETGIGFGVIAQVLWLTQEIPGADLDDFLTLLDVRRNNTYTELPFVDDAGTTVTPANWGELRNAILAGRRVGTLGTIISNREENPSADVRDHQPKNKDKEKYNEKEPGNNSRGNGNNR